MPNFLLEDEMPNNLSQSYFDFGALEPNLRPTSIVQVILVFLKLKMLKMFNIAYSTKALV